MALEPWHEKPTSYAYSAGNGVTATAAVKGIRIMIKALVFSTAALVCAYVPRAHAENDQAAAEQTKLTLVAKKLHSDLEKFSKGDASVTAEMLEQDRKAVAQAKADVAVAQFSTDSLPAS